MRQAGPGQAPATRRREIVSEVVARTQGREVPRQDCPKAADRAENLADQVGNEKKVKKPLDTK